MHTEDIILDSTDLIENFDGVLEEVVKTILPESIKSYLSSKSKRELMKEKYGDDSFLIPSKLKFPVVDPKTGKPHCGLIYAARIRARQFQGRKPGYREIANKAEELYRKHNCENKIHVQLKESNSVVELGELLEAIVPNDDI